jgi:hypothetical protein
MSMAFREVLFHKGPPHTTEHPDHFQQPVGLTFGRRLQPVATALRAAFLL